MNFASKMMNFALLVIKERAEQERLDLEASMAHKKKIGLRELAKEGIQVRF